MLAEHAPTRPILIDFDELRRTEKRIAQAGQARGTRTAYASSWRTFTSWCAALSKSPLPAEPRTLQDFATWCIVEKKRMSTIAVHISAIAHQHAAAGLESP